MAALNVVYARLAAAPKLVSVALGAAASAQACAEYQPSLLKGDLVADAGSSGGSGSAGAMGSPPIAGSGSGDGAGGNGGGGASASGGSSGGTDTCSPGAAGSATCCPDAGACGCGQPQTDSDLDGAPDCADQCPEDPDKAAPGDCGCGVPDQDGASGAGCTGLRDALIHRYSFDGSGTTVSDSVGGAHGLAVNATLTGSGLLTLNSGAEDQYVDLPNGIISALTDATFEVWLNWSASTGSEWQRIFDFGTSDMGEDARGSGQTYIFLSPKTFRTAYKNESPGEILIDAPAVFPASVTTHVAVVVDDANDSLRLYLNAVLQGSVSLAVPLSSIDDVNNWLGRSQFAPDPQFGGTLREFRIYDAALSQAQLELSHALGEATAILD